MDLYANGLRTVTATSSSGTSAPVAGIVETWTVNTLPADFPTLNIGQHVRLIDQNAPSEIIQVTQMSPGATSIQVVRGVEGTTPIAHGSGAIYQSFVWTNAANNMGEGGALIDSASTFIAQQAGPSSTTTWNQVSGSKIVVPAGVPYCLKLVMQFGVFVNNAAVGSSIHFNTQIRNAAAVSVHAIPPYGASNYANYGDEYYVVPVAGQNTIRTHTEEWDMPPLAAADVYSVYMMCSDIGSPTVSTGWNCPVSGLGGPLTLSARRNG